MDFLIVFNQAPSIASQGFSSPQIFNYILIIYRVRVMEKIKIKKSSATLCLIGEFTLNHVEEVREDLERVEEVFHDNGTVSFKNRKFWHFLPAGT